MPTTFTEESVASSSSRFETCDRRIVYSLLTSVRLRLEPDLLSHSRHRGVCLTAAKRCPPRPLARRRNPIQGRPLSRPHGEARRISCLGRSEHLGVDPLAKRFAVYTEGASKRLLARPRRLSLRTNAQRSIFRSLIQKLQKKREASQHDSQSAQSSLPRRGTGHAISSRHQGSAQGDAAAGGQAPHPVRRRGMPFIPGFRTSSSLLAGERPPSKITLMSPLSWRPRSKPRARKTC
jgi:hypothetical protein